MSKLDCFLGMMWVDGFMRTRMFEQALMMVSSLMMFN